MVMCLLLAEKTAVALQFVFSPIALSHDIVKYSTSYCDTIRSGLCLGHLLAPLSPSSILPMRTFNDFQDMFRPVRLGLQFWSR